MKKEYKQILEKLPEGILIIDDKHDTRFMNSELRDVLNVSEQNENEGLRREIFKIYTIEEDLQLQNSGAKEESLQSIIENADWKQADEQFCELKMAAKEEEGVDEEMRVFAQIKKLDLQFRQKPAIMVIIRNISHIIKYEKAKNENKY